MKDPRLCPGRGCKNQRAKPGHGRKCSKCRTREWKKKNPVRYFENDRKHKEIRKAKRRIAILATQT
jgi:hypothetical protein